jgi:hypothetical protein
LAQAIPLPVPIPLPFELPLPSEITPFPPLILPDGMQRDPVPANPYPDRPECEEEWAHAANECGKMFNNYQLKPGRRGFGADIARCIRGMVSQDCSGNPVQWMTA